MIIHAEHRWNKRQPIKGSQWTRPNDDERQRQAYDDLLKLELGVPVHWDGYGPAA